MKVADEVWVSTALLHTENPERIDFAVEEIKARAIQEKWPIRPGFNVHASYHCIANKAANPANHRLLYEDSRGRKRLYREGDPYHPERQHGKVRPNKPDLPPQYQNLIDWYDSAYSRQSRPTQSGGNSGASSAQGSEREMLPLSAQSTAFVSSAGAFVVPENLRRELGIHEGTRLSIHREEGRLVIQPVTEDVIDRIAGSYKGKASLVEAREREHRIE